MWPDCACNRNNSGGDRHWSIRKGLLQLRIANLTKAGPRQRRGEGGVPSLLRPGVPTMSSAPSDLEFISHPAGRLTICNCELQST
jgi:hypothetical protein